MHLPDPSILQRIENALQNAGVEVDGLAATLAEAAKGDELNRRQLMSRTEAAFKEGFLTGKRWPKFVPYATDVWRKSDFYGRYYAQKGGSPEAENRYAKYNDLG
jgi:hypothetical protein